MMTATEPGWVVELRGACRSDHPSDEHITDVLDRVACFPSHPRFAEVLRYLLENHLIDFDEMLVQRTYLQRCVVAEERCAPLPDAPPPVTQATQAQHELVWYTTRLVPDYHNPNATRGHTNPELVVRAFVYRAAYGIDDTFQRAGEQFWDCLRTVTEILAGLRDADTER